MTEPSQSVIACEGYEDRAFWAEWLEQRGCPRPGAGLRDPFGDPVKGGGEYGYYAASGRFIRIIPTLGDRDRVLRAAKRVLTGRNTHHLDHLIVNWDPDASGDPRPSARDAVEGLLQGMGIGWTVDVNGDHRLDDGVTAVSIALWWAEDPVPIGTPTQQALERLACAALAEVYPSWGASVATWLDQRPDADRQTKLHKAHARAFMAGWFADHGCDDFYRAVWRDPKTRDALLRHLQASGIAGAVDRLVAPL